MVTARKMQEFYLKQSAVSIQHSALSPLSFWAEGKLHRGHRSVQNLLATNTHEMNTNQKSSQAGPWLWLRVYLVLLTYSALSPQTFLG